jgi:hypothetical protein
MLPAQQCSPWLGDSAVSMLLTLEYLGHTSESRNDVDTHAQLTECQRSSSVKLDQP